MYVPFPHGSFSDITKYEVFSIISFARSSEFLRGGDLGKIRNIITFFRPYEIFTSSNNESCKSRSEF